MIFKRKEYSWKVILGEWIGAMCMTEADGSTGLVFDNCRVSVKNMLGSKGDDLIHMMKNLEIERLTLAALSMGMAAKVPRDND